MNNKLSVTIITKNEEENIQRCLNSVKWADEIVVVDSGSEDKTLEICREYDVKIVETEWLGFGRTKQLAVEQCENDWVLVVDADEVITKDLKSKIKSVLKNPQYSGYRIKRNSFYLEKMIKHCGWDNDYTLRLFNRNKGGFNQKLVHESVKIEDGKIGKIEEYMLHYTYPDLTTYLDKNELYGELKAKSTDRQVSKFFPIIAAAKAIFKFFHMYIIRLGLLDGIMGFVLSINSAFSVYYKYLKVWEKSKDRKLTFIVSRTDRIGDLILSIPSFYMLRKMYPDSEIILLVNSYNFDIVKNLDYINKIIKKDTYTKEELSDKLKSFSPDYFIALYTDSDISQLARQSGAKYRIGPYSKLHSFFSYNKGCLQKRSWSKKNEAEYNLDLIKKVAPYKYEGCYEIDTSIKYEPQHAKLADKIVDGETVVIHPFNGGSANNLTPQQYLNLIDYLLENSDFNILLIGHILEAEKFQNYFGMDNDRVEEFINEKSLLYTAAVIDKASLFVGSSSGPIHIAGALNKKIVAFYSAIRAQSPHRWGVFNNDQVLYFGNKFDCPGKLSCKKSCDYYNCFDKLNMDEIGQEIINMMNQ